MRTLALALAAALTAAPVAAQTVCNDRDEIVKILDKHGETRRSYGLQNDYRMLELYASPDGTWTAILTMPSGRSCVIGVGTHWQELPTPLPGAPA